MSETRLELPRVGAEPPPTLYAVIGSEYDTEAKLVTVVPISETAASYLVKRSELGGYRTRLMKADLEAHRIAFSREEAIRLFVQEKRRIIDAAYRRAGNAEQAIAAARKL